MRSWWVAGLFLFVALAGCTDTAAPVEDVDEATPLATGVLRGVVVDPTIRPLAAAAVLVKQNGTAVIEVTTDGNGEFGIQDLAAGNYSVNVSKPGYIATEVPARVVGGENLPPLVEIMLTPAPVDSAYVWPIIWEGMVTCGTTFQNWCAAVNFVSGVKVFGDESFKFLFDEFMEQNRTPDFLQVEVVWEPNSDASRWAYAGFWASTWEEWEECLCTPNILATVEGSEHLLVQVEGGLMREYDVGFSTGVGVGFSAGSSTALSPESATDPQRYSVMVNQPFEAFMHVFYGCLPEEGWLFTVDGDPTCDPKSFKAAETGG